MKRWVWALLLILACAAPASAQVIGSSNITAGGTTCTPATRCAIFTPGNAPSVTLQVSGTYSGTLQFEGSADGVTWVAVMAVNLADSSQATSTTSTGQFALNNPGFSTIRVRCSAYTSGTAHVTATRGWFGAKATGGVSPINGVVNAGGGSAQPDPTSAPTVAENGAGTLTGTYAYCYYEQAGGSTACSSSNSITVSGKIVRVTVPLPRRGSSTRVLCRTTNGGSTFKTLHDFGGGDYFFATGWDDQTADGSLGANCPTTNSSTVYSLSLNPTVKYFRTNADQGSVAADLSLLTSDPSTPGAYAMDSFGPLVARTTGAAASIFTQHTISTTGYHFLAQTLPAVDAGAAGTPVFRVNANGNVGLTPSTLTDQGGADGLNYAISSSATFATTNTANGQAVLLNATGAGSSSFDQSAIKATLAAGYTGSSNAYGGLFTNTSANTGQSFGVRGQATGAAALNVGGMGYATTGTKNIGLFSSSAGVEPTTTTVPFTGGVGGISLVAANGTNTDDLIVAVDGTTTPLEVFRVKNAGDVSSASETGDASLQWDWTATSGGGNMRLLMTGGTNAAFGSTNNIPVNITTNGVSNWSFATGGSLDLLVAGNAIRSAIPVEANTGTKTPTALESGELYTNTGDGDGSAITLLNDPTIGTTYRVAVTVAQTITVTASAGETLYFGATTCGTSLTSNVVGSAATFAAVTGGSGAIWVTLGTTGTWVCTP